MQRQTPVLSMYSRSDEIWSQQVYVKASNTGIGDVFDTSIALSWDTLVVGAIFEASNSLDVNSVAQSDNTESASGAVYIIQ